MAVSNDYLRRLTRRDLAVGLLALPMITSACASGPTASEGWPLWRAERNGKHAYLTGGTPPRQTDWRQARIETIAAGCDLIWTETNKISRGTIRDVVMRLGVDASAPLSERIPERDWLRVKTAAAQAGVTIESINQFRPWLAAHTIGEASDESRGWVGQSAESAIAAAALQNSTAILVETIDEAVEILNEYAPEHLIIATERADDVAERIVNAGSVFIGNFSCESAGDYASGTNHTLPTGGAARAYSGVSVSSFNKTITFQKLTADGVRGLGPIVETLAAAEGLDAHRNAMALRRESVGRAQ